MGMVRECGNVRVWESLFLMETWLEYKGPKSGFFYHYFYKYVLLLVCWCAGAICYRGGAEGGGQLCVCCVVSCRCCGLYVFACLPAQTPGWVVFRTVACLPTCLLSTYLDIERLLMMGWCSFSFVVLLNGLVCVVW